MLTAQGLPPMLLPYMRLSYTSDPDLLQRPGFFNAGPSSEYSEKLALAQLTAYLEQRLSRQASPPALSSLAQSGCASMGVQLPPHAEQSISILLAVRSNAFWSCCNATVVQLSEVM